MNPLVNAYCTLAPEVARRAALAAERRFMSGHPLGALDGVPFSLKDLTPTRGIRTTYGSKVFEHHVPDHDGLVAERLLAAGGVLLGKTNTPEFGGRSITDNRIFGPTRNPWDSSKVAGGSSGGAAAAVATGMGPVAHGSDSSGSIRIPAAACGVVGLRPTVGRVAVYPTPNAWQSISVDGPLARTVRDTALLFGAMCGRDERDPLSLPGSSEDFVAACDRSIQGLRVAWTSDLGYLKVDPTVAGAIRTAAKAFIDLGCEVEEAHPRVEGIAEIRHDLLPRIGAAYVGYLRDWEPDMDPAVVRVCRQSEEISALDFERGFYRRTQLFHTMREFFERYDLLLTATLPRVPFAIGPWDPVIEGDLIQCTFPFSLTGSPAISVPAAWTATGLPIGLQIVSRPLAESLLLSAAAGFEAIRPWAHRRPPLTTVAAQGV